MQDSIIDPNCTVVECSQAPSANQLLHNLGAQSVASDSDAEVQESDEDEADPARTQTQVVIYDPAVEHNHALEHFDAQADFEEVLTQLDSPTHRTLRVIPARPTSEVFPTRRRHATLTDTQVDTLRTPYVPVNTKVGRKKWVAAVDSFLTETHEEQQWSCPTFEEFHSTNDKAGAAKLLQAFFANMRMTKIARAGNVNLVHSQQ
jgi:hypothetical protein